MKQLLFIVFLIHQIWWRNWMDKSKSIVKKIYNQIKNLKIGEFSNPITTAGGSLILKIDEIKKL